MIISVISGKKRKISGNKKNIIMKKLLLLLVAPCVVFSTLSAQITQKEADEIVQQRLDGETKPYTVYAKETVQTEGFTVMTATGEILALEYPCWAYYVDYMEDTNGKYLIIKESNGNLLEVKTKKDTGPDDLTEWRVVTFEIEYPIEIPFEEYSLEGTSCQWDEYLYYPINNGDVFISNSNEELDKFCIRCDEGTYPEIDFTQYSLLLVTGKTNYSISGMTINGLQLLMPNQYALSIEFTLKDILVSEKWLVALVVPKMNQTSNVVLNLTHIGGNYPVEIPCEEFSLEGSSCLWKYFTDHIALLINNSEDLEEYINCPVGNYPVIDFDNYSLIVARGLFPSSPIWITNVFLFKYDPVEYVYRVELMVGYAGTPGSWLSAILIPKIADDAVISLEIEKYP